MTTREVLLACACSFALGIGFAVAVREKQPDVDRRPICIVVGITQPTVSFVGKVEADGSVICDPRNAFRTQEGKP